jgi:hypothetical protein
MNPWVTKHIHTTAIANEISGYALKIYDSNFIGKVRNLGSLSNRWYLTPWS